MGEHLGVGLLRVETRDEHTLRLVKGSAEKGTL